ncbi:MAG: thermonuclease family protein [Candidatus Omnitrophica bacterium]|nr:thermonuclease family protein [Candidatus Omnitrophota bacterium]MCB9747750.1 thermonuclease family protein [Candidatus Omnitrophota bacterium]
MEVNILNQSQYSTLLQDIRRLIKEGKERAGRAAANELVKTYWEIGRRINREQMTFQAGYADSIIEDLADELQIDRWTLKRTLLFFNTYPGGAPRGSNLNWAHYRELITINDDQERQWYERHALKQRLTRDQLVKAIKKNVYQEKTLLNNSNLIKSDKIIRPTEATYVYRAYVVRVISADRLLLRLDLGFQVLKEQRIRLADIEAPAMDDPKGREAYEYVLGKLVQSPMVVVKTSKIDIYGRYLAYLFYSTKKMPLDMVFEKGQFLNQEMVDNGLAHLA